MPASTKLTSPQDINFVVFVEKRGKKIFLAARPTNEDSLNGHASNTPPRESRIVNQQFLAWRGQSSSPLRKAFPFSRQRLLLDTRLTNCLREDYRERRRRVIFSIFLSFLFSIEKEFQNPVCSLLILGWRMLLQRRRGRVQGLYDP